MVRTLIKACLLLLIPLVISPARADEALYMRLTARLEAAEDAMKWQEAIRLTNEILRLCQKEDYVKHETRLAEIGIYQLNLLDIEGAQQSCESVLAELRQKRFSGGWAEEISYYNMARIATIRGDYRNALYWLEKYEYAFGNGCGNCDQGKDGDAYLHRIVWRTGLLPTLEAKTALKHIIAGEFVPRGGRIQNGKDLIERGVVSRFLYVPFMNEAGEKYDDAAKLAEKQTEDAIKQLTPLLIVGSVEMEAKAKELRLKMPLSESDIQKVGRALGVHAILEGRLTFVNSNKELDRDVLDVGVTISAYHLESGGTLEREASSGNLLLKSGETISDIIASKKRTYACVKLAKQMADWLVPYPDEEYQKFLQKNVNREEPLDPENKWQVDAAKDEAKLMLAQILITERNFTEARQLMKDINKKSEAGSLAAAYTRRGLERPIAGAAR